MKSSAQLALNLNAPAEPASRPKVEGAFAVHVADGKGEAITLPIIADSRQEAEQQAAVLAGVDEDRCLAIQVREDDWSADLMTMLGEANERAEADLQHLRGIHAKILGIPIGELDARVAADKAKEAAERANWKNARAPRTSSRKSGEVPASAGRPEEPTTETGRELPAAVPSSASCDSLPTMRLTDRQREMLQGFEVADNVARFTLTEHQSDWAEVKSVFKALGAKWQTGGKKKVGGFHFADDADGAELVRLALESGEILDPQAAGYFPTPRTLVRRLVELADIRPGAAVLEPSAGRGSIAHEVRRACPTARISCVELLPDNRAALERDGFDLIGDDFLKVSPKGAWFDAVCMNPPFAKRADIIHVEHAFQFLNPGGSLVSIMSAGVLYRDDEQGRRFRHFVEMAEGRFEENPDGSFAESGTMVRTVTLVIPRRAA